MQALVTPIHTVGKGVTFTVDDLFYIYILPIISFHYDHLIVAGKQVNGLPGDVWTRTI